jgi:hypothetical protein
MKDSFSRSQTERGIAVSAVQVQAGCLPHKLLDSSFRSTEFKPYKKAFSPDLHKLLI